VLDRVVEAVDLVDDRAALRAQPADGLPRIQVPIHPVETVDDEERPVLVAAVAHGQGLRRHRLAAGVVGRDAQVGRGVPGNVIQRRGQHVADVDARVKTIAFSER